MFKVAFSVLALGPLAFGLVASCGGSSFEDSGAGGQAGVGGSGSSGSPASGGSSAGNGGGLAALCKLPLEGGVCDAFVPSWGHDVRTGVCVPFVYGGCGGNANRFATRDACQAACTGGSPNADACTTPSDCMLVSPACCGACEPVDARSFVAVNRQNASVFSGMCNVACSPCPAPAPGGATSQFFVPTCVSGQCTAVDIREAPLTECSSNGDCMLRAGANCCPSCSGSAPVAINKRADLASLVCGKEPVACPACAASFPDGVQAVCTDQRCTVKWPCSSNLPCTQ